MLLNLFLQVTLLATAALSDASTVLYPDDSQIPLVGGVLLEDCGPGISVCGKMAPPQVISKHKQTIYRTEITTFKEITMLPPETVTVTELELSTIDISTEGQCRTTIVVTDPNPLYITVGRKITETESIQPTINVTTVITSTTYKKKVAHCIVKTSNVLGASPTPRVPPAKPSEDKSSSPTPTPDNKAKESASPGSSAPAAAKKDADPKGSNSKPAAPKKP